jgi:multidrug efflux system membrane fusion protein
MRPTLFVLLPLIVLAACTKPEPLPEPVRAVRTVVVQAGQASMPYEYAAEIRARIESRLGFRVAGKVTERLVQAGDAVRPGQPLARLDPQDLRLGQEAAQAALASAQANLEMVDSEYRRYAALREQGYISSAELERRDAGLKAARAQVVQLQAQVGVQANQSTYAVLAADARGLITGVEVEPGMVVAAGATVFRLAHDGPRDAWFTVPEDRVAALRPLMGRAGALQVRLWGEDTRLWPASVREIAAAADPATRTFLVKADLGAAPVRLGQTATVILQSPGLPGLIQLPLSAVFEQAGRATVWLLDEASMTVKHQPVTVGGAQGNEVVIAAGLTPGQSVVSAGVHTLAPGQKVRHYVEPRAGAR